jgi:hypothetical protein
VDRLDLWLNAQRGWRREALIWLQLAPLTFMLGAAAFALFGLTAWGVAGPIALAALFRAAVRMRPAIGHARKKWIPPLFSWRRMAGLLALSASQSPNAFIAAEYGTSGWQHWHRVTGAVALVASIAFLAALIADLRYTRRLSRQATAAPQAGPELAAG